MGKVFIYSFLMILGIAVSQVIDLSAYRSLLNFLLIALLGYIMIEVGLEFTIEKGKLRSYGKDYLIAATAAAFPWLLCSIYFWLCFEIDLSKALVVGRFAAPTSAGILFTMLAAAGLATTWVFKKARILAIFDDLDTVLLIVPLQMIHIGLEWRAFVLLLIIASLLVAAYLFLHRLKLPTSRPCLLFYAILLALASEHFEKTTLINLEILLPAFVLGCLLVNPHNPRVPFLHRHEHEYIEPNPGWEKHFDTTIKLTYMFLVGCSLPKMTMTHVGWAFIAFHVTVLLFLSNLGKLYPMFCYKKEATFRERLALSIAMWPRGEVGAGVLVISMNYAIAPIVLQLAQLSLVLNLALTGLFIFIVIWLLQGSLQRR